MSDEQTDDTVTAKPTDPLIEALDKLGRGSNFLWIIFIFTITPSMFNGMHSMSYIFIAEVRSTYFYFSLRLAQEAKRNNHTMNTQMLHVTEFSLRRFPLTGARYQA